MARISPIATSPDTKPHAVGVIPRGVVARRDAWGRGRENQRPMLPANYGDIEQIEVVRGPASATWGANAMTGAVNIVTKPPRQSVGTTVTMSGGWIDRDAGSTVDRGAGTLFGTNATVTRAPTDRLAYRISAGYFKSDAFPRPTGRIPVIDDPRAPGAKVGGAQYPADRAGQFGGAFANRGTSQPKFDVRVDQELSDGRISYSGGVAGTEGLAHTGIGPFDIQRGTYMSYASVGYTRGALRAQVFGEPVGRRRAESSAARSQHRQARSISRSSRRPSMRRLATPRSSGNETS